MAISPSGWWINKLQMRSPQSNWLAAFFFPLKIYTLLVGIILLCWHANLPSNQTDFHRLSRTPHIDFDEVWFQSATDFAYLSNSARLGYFLCAIVLIVGGAIQFYKVSRKAGILSIIFGLAALLIGLLLTSYARPPSWSIQVL